MITPTTIYFIGILDSIKSLFLITAFVTGMILLIAVICLVLNQYQLSESDQHKFHKFITFYLSLSVIFSILTTFTPPSKVAASMYVIPAIANNKDIKAIGNNGLEVLYKLTEQWLKEISGVKPSGEEGNK